VYCKITLPLFRRNFDKKNIAFYELFLVFRALLSRVLSGTVLLVSLVPLQVRKHDQFRTTRMYMTGPTRARYSVVLVLRGTSTPKYYGNNSTVPVLRSTFTTNPYSGYLLFVLVVSTTGSTGTPLQRTCTIFVS
jgi:hypothetical protein